MVDAREQGEGERRRGLEGQIGPYWHEHRRCRKSRGVDLDGSTTDEQIGGASAYEDRVELGVEINVSIFPRPVK